MSGNSTFASTTRTEKNDIVLIKGLLLKLMGILWDKKRIVYFELLPRKVFGEVYAKNSSLKTAVLETTTQKRHSGACLGD